MKNIIKTTKWHKIKIWGKSIIIIDWWNIYKTYCEVKWITNFKESYTELIKILNNITCNFEFSKIQRNDIFVFVGYQDDI